MSETSDISAVPLRDKPLQQLNRIAKRPPLDIEFQDLSYSVRDNNTKGGWREILKSVNGRFRCGELTAIMGPSGAGKSTLLNILAGYVTTGVQGSIKVNNAPRNMKIFNKLCSYIMQEDIIQPHLTVKEAMLFAACLKLGAHITRDDKLAVVQEVITLLGLEKCCDTRSQYLSGGQRKRLSVALELVNNPPVIFLDEPTTGLDNFAINQCIDLLRKISKLGRTVICTIHQPPASLFHRFDQVYIVADGYCAYNGSSSQLVPFLSNAEFACPQNNTPADFVIELVHSNPSVVSQLTSLIQNGRVNMRSTPEKTLGVDNDEFSGIYQDTTQSGIQKSDIDFATSFWIQYSLILHRMWLQVWRDKSGLYIQFFHHFLSGAIIGGIFYGAGNNASQTIALFKYCICCSFFFMYTHVMMPVIIFPMEVALMKREYFNRWYGLKPYYLALTTATLPQLLILGTMFSCIVYFMVGHPMEWNRFIGFCLVGLAIGLTSQGLGYAIGSLFYITYGSIVGASFLAPLLALSCYGMGYRSTIEPVMQFIMSITFTRHGLTGYCNALFFKRTPLECTDEIYCHYARPEILMKDMAIPTVAYQYPIMYILIFMFVFRIAGYMFLKCRVNSELSSKIVYVASKVIKHKR